MTVHARLARDLYDQVRADLIRPHPHAGERVGFLYARLGNAGTDHPIIIFTRYVPLADDRYIRDPFAGARIDGTAIREAMQGVLSQGEGVFHVHIHEWPGEPGWSPMDLRELPRLIPGFKAVGPKLPHGLFLLSPDHFAGAVWLPGNTTSVPMDRVTVVGFPTQIFERTGR
jgi:hypothetical protein